MREVLSSLDRSYTHAIQGHVINITSREKTPFRTFAVCVYTQKVVLSRYVSNPGGGGGLKRANTNAHASVLNTILC